MIHFFYGENDFEINRSTTQICDKFANENGTDSITKFDASEVEADKIFSEIVNVNLFAPRRLFVIKNAFSNKIFIEKLSDFLSRIPDENDVILLEKKPDKRTKIYKDLIKKANAKEFKILREFDLKKWLNSEVKSQKINMKSLAQNELINLLNGEENPQNKIAKELEKFALFDKEITTEKVREIIEPNLASNAFEILNLAIKNEREKCAAELKKLRESGEDTNRFLGLIASQIFALAGAIYGGENAAKELKIHPFQLSKMREIAQTFGDENAQKNRIKKMSEIVAKADAKIKLSRADEAWIVLEVALSKM